MGIWAKILGFARVKSPWLLHFDCGSCNGCDIEILASLTPVYDLERFGIVNVGNPLHADVLLVSGTVNHCNRIVLVNLFNQMPAPKVVVAIGACGLSGGIFRGAYNVVGGIDRVIPVDVYVPGCPPRPEAIVDGVLLGLEKLITGGVTPDTTDGPIGATEENHPCSRTSLTSDRTVCSARRPGSNGMAIGSSQ